MSLIRAVVAAGLSVLFPGAGHVVLRDWIRAAVFAGMFLTILVIALPLDQLSAVDSVSGTADLLFEETSTMDRFFISFVVLFAAMDALFRGLNLGSRSNGSDAGPSCPHCGRELDEDLEFCHWCTARLEPTVEDESTSP